jgi:2,3-bisphosphoglycerate-dependent phosphoglycerate mutase
MPAEELGRLIAVRHGCSTWNATGRFTGSADVDLAPLGRDEAFDAGRVLAGAGVEPALVVSSALRRAHKTAGIIADLCSPRPELVRTADLDERDHGVLEGLTHHEAEVRFGVEQVRAWRRTDEGGPPSGESFAQVVTRVRRAWSGVIAPALLQGSTVVVVGHGTSLRGLLVAAGAPSQAASRFEVPRAQPAEVGLVIGEAGEWLPLSQRAEAR